MSHPQLLHANDLDIYAASATVTDLVATTLNLPSGVAGDILYHNGTSFVRLAKGTAGQFLVMNGGATAPSWVTYP